MLIINEILMDGDGGELSCACNRLVNFTTFVQADTAQIQAVSANLQLRYTFRRKQAFTLIIIPVNAVQSTIDRAS